MLIIVVPSNVCNLNYLLLRKEEGRCIQLLTRDRLFTNELHLLNHISIRLQQKSSFSSVPVSLNKALQFTFILNDYKRNSIDRGKLQDYIRFLSTAHIIPSFLISYFIDTHVFLCEIPFKSTAQRIDYQSNDYHRSVAQLQLGLILNRMMYTRCLMARYYYLNGLTG